jgi:predicted Rdx family selenoprotein
VAWCFLRFTSTVYLKPTSQSTKKIELQFNICLTSQWVARTEGGLLDRFLQMVAKDLRQVAIITSLGVNGMVALMM